MMPNRKSVDISRRLRTTDKEGREIVGPDRRANVIDGATIAGDASGRYVRNVRRPRMRDARSGILRIST